MEDVSVKWQGVAQVQFSTQACLPRLAARTDLVGPTRGFIPAAGWLLRTAFSRMRCGIPSTSVERMRKMLFDGEDRLYVILNETQNNPRDLTLIE